MESPTKNAYISSLIKFLKFDAAGAAIGAVGIIGEGVSYAFAARGICHAIDSVISEPRYGGFVAGIAGTMMGLSTVSSIVLVKKELIHWLDENRASDPEFRLHIAERSARDDFLSAAFGIPNGHERLARSFGENPYRHTQRAVSLSESVGSVISGLGLGLSMGHSANAFAQLWGPMTITIKC
jgi:hypothetical protein